LVAVCEFFPSAKLKPSIAVVCSDDEGTKQVLTRSERPELVLAGEHGQIEGIHVGQISNWTTVPWLGKSRWPCQSSNQVK